MLSELGTTDAFEFYRTFIEWFVSRAPMNYLEIGAHSGGLTARISLIAMEAVGVDIETYPDWPKYERAYPRVKLIKTSSDEFFAANDKKFGCIFIDGDHHHKQVMRDVMNAKECLADEGIIVLHDSVPPDDRHTESDKCGSVYIAVEALEIDHKEFDILTFPVRYGMTVLSVRR